MNRLEDLPKIAARQLGGLEADANILARAKQAAQARRAPRTLRLRPVVAVCAALVLCVAAAWTLGGEGWLSGVTAQPTPNILDSHSAGDDALNALEPRLSADIQPGAVSMGVGNQSGSGTLFADGSGSSFPLLTINGATYRMLISPDGISSSLLGDSLGTVNEFNVEPALGSGGIVSNTVSTGETVYAVSGMNGALVAANVNGSTRVFQRVSYAGTAIIGSETLADTLCDASDVAWIEWTGMGTVSDANAAQALMQTLLDYADYQNNGMSGSGSVRIGLCNGLTLQLLTDADTVSACGTWSCPEFFDAFRAALGL